ncbi:hypothetical protein [Moraxella lacunata]
MLVGGDCRLWTARQLACGGHRGDAGGDDALAHYQCRPCRH